jgi:hypothetical protein
VVSNDSPDCFRAIRNFIKIAPWPRSTIYIARFRPAVRDARAQETSGYLEAHGWTVTIVDADFRRSSQVLSWSAANGIDLLVADWSWFRMIDTRVIRPSAGNRPSLFTST